MSHRCYVHNDPACSCVELVSFFQTGLLEVVQLLEVVSYPDPNVRNDDYRLQYNITYRGSGNEVVGNGSMLPEFGRTNQIAAICDVYIPTLRLIS